MRDAYSRTTVCVRGLFLTAVGLSLGGALVALAASYLGLPVISMLAWYASAAGLLKLSGVGALVLLSALLVFFERESASPRDTVA